MFTKQNEVKKIKAHIPVWALSYINNLDYFTIEADKMRMIENWIEEQKDNVFDKVDIELISFTGEVESTPAFGGEACMCGECIITVKRYAEMEIH